MADSAANLPTAHDPPWRAQRVYLLPEEKLEPGSSCPTCAKLAQKIRTEKRTHRRHIPGKVLESPDIVLHLEHDVLGRPIGFGDPTQFAQAELRD
jgi:hypothetical protein